MKQLSLEWQVGRFLRLRMKLAGRTIYNVAMQTGMTPTNVLEVVAGQAMPRFAEIEMVAACIDTTVQEVLIAGWAMTDAWDLERGRFGL